MLLIKEYPFKYQKMKEGKRVRKIVERIIMDISRRGDDAIVYWTRKLDCPQFNKENIKLENSDCCIEPEMENLIKKLKKRIEDFAKAQREGLKEKIELNRCAQILIPVQKAGIYVPSGKYPLFTSLLMSVVPAKVAGVEEIYVATPPDKEKKISPYIHFCAKLAGVKEIFRVGGAQAIAGMALGTETIPKVDLIAGAGNKYVQTAKKILFGIAGIDTFAGPSEIVIVADEGANPEFIAWDLISQAEHGDDSMAILVTPSKKLAEKVKRSMIKIIKKIPQRETIKKSLKKKGEIILVEDMKYAFNLVNEIAPEHLSLQIKEPEKWLNLIKNAGAIFVGENSPVAIGDYWAGPSHILPTGGTSRFLSHLSVRTFLKEVSIISFDKKELLESAKDVIALAEKEGLFAHAGSIKVREKFKKMSSKNFIRLDKNESPFEPPGFFKREILKRCLKIKWSRYPEEEEEVKELISDYAKFELDGITIGNGSNELIQAIFLKFLEKGKKVLLPEPCFSIYPWMAKLLKAKIIKTPLDSEFRYDEKDLLRKTMDFSPSLIVIISPHNPCGSEIQEDTLLKIFRIKNSHVLIDEAYYEFSGKSFKKYIKNFKNLMILRTFSKAFSIAGLRAGYLLGNSDLIKMVEDSKPPFSVNSFTLSALKFLLTKSDFVKSTVEKIKKEREKLYKDLKEIDHIKPYPSSGNFLLFELNKIDSTTVYENMVKRGVLLRKFNSPRLKKCLRVTVGKENENRKFINELKEVLNELKK